MSEFSHSHPRPKSDWWPHAWLLAWIGAAPMLPVSLLVLLCAGTAAGRAAGGLGICAALAPWIWLGRKAAVLRAPTWRRVEVISLAAGLGAVAVLAFHFPAPSRESSSGARELYWGGASAEPRWFPTQWVPEEDQLSVGFRLMSVADQLFTANQATRLSAMTAEVRREYDTAEDFRGLRSSLSWMYAEVAGWRRDGGHAFACVPSGIDRTKPQPALVFFHGSGGNFRAYLWVLSRIAEETRRVVIAPTDGLGNWRGDDAATRTLAACDAFTDLKIDRTRIAVMGLSNGGLAVCRVVADAAFEPEVIVLVSPVFDAVAIGRESFARRVAGKRVLVLSGSDDDRIPRRYVEEESERLRRGGAKVTNVWFATDHFLLLSHRAEVQRRVGEWIR